MRQKQKTETANQKLEREWRAFLRDARRAQITGPKPKPKPTEVRVNEKFGQLAAALTALKLR